MPYPTQSQSTPSIPLPTHRTKRPRGSADYASHAMHRKILAALPLQVLHRHGACSVASRVQRRSSKTVRLPGVQNMLNKLRILKNKLNQHDPCVWPPNNRTYNKSKTKKKNICKFQNCQKSWFRLRLSSKSKTRFLRFYKQMSISIFVVSDKKKNKNFSIYFVYLRIVERFYDH